jgi:hypothetical protein
MITAESSAKYIFWKISNEEILKVTNEFSNQQAKQVVNFWLRFLFISWWFWYILVKPENKTDFCSNAMQMVQKLS